MRGYNPLFIREYMMDHYPIDKDRFTYELSDETLQKHITFINHWEQSVGEDFLDYFFDDVVYINSWALWLLGKGYRQRANFLIESIQNNEIDNLDNDSKFHPNLTELHYWEAEKQIHANPIAEYNDSNYTSLYNSDIALWVEFLLSIASYKDTYLTWAENQLDMLNDANGFHNYEV